MIGASLLLLAAWIVVPRLTRRSAAERHLYWAAALGAATVMPFLSFVVPPWRPEWASRVADLLPGAVSGGERWTSGDANADVVIRAVGLEQNGLTLAEMATLVWIAGSAVGLFQLTMKAVTLWRLAKTAPRLLDARLTRIARTVLRELRVSAPVRFLQSPTGAVPMTWGLWRPAVMLPACAETWPDRRARAVVAHELAHVRRHDWVVHVLAELSCRALWFHPLVWVARGHLWTESERAADDSVIRLGVESSEYAEHLLAIVRTARSPAGDWSPTVAMARRSGLERRFEALVQARANRRAPSRWTIAAAAAMALLVTVPLGSMSLLRGMPGIEIKMADLPAIVDAAAPSNREPAAPAVKDVRVAAPDAAGETRPPTIVEYTTPPLYSDEARRRGVEGVVTIGADIQADGRVSGTRMLHGLGFGLDQNALVALRQWRFQPGTVSGRPTAMQAEIDIEFSLRNEAVNALVANDMATRVGPGITPPHAVRAFSLWRRDIARHGKVVLDVVLQEDGTPRIVRILQSLDPELDESAAQNFSQWRFSPALKNGHPVKVRLNAEVTFHG